jgi:GNAT superfamily N-acetyltransferase
VHIKPVEPGDIEACQRIFDTSYGDLHRRYELEDEEPADADWLRPILAHFLTTDPTGTLLASEAGEPIAFASSFRRDDYWFLSFLFVDPAFQGRGLGRTLLEELAPARSDAVLATVVESFQPVSTGLYAKAGMSPQAIKYWLTGVSRTGSLPPLPSDLHREPVTETDQVDIDALDRSVLGFTRPLDHRWWRDAKTPCWSYRRGSNLVAYAYVDDGYVGPVLAADEGTLCLVIADLVGGAEDPASMSVNLCGHSAEAFRMLMEAGARIDDTTAYRFVYCSSAGPLPASYIHHSDWLP